MIHNSEIDRLFASMLNRLDPDPRTGYNRDFYDVFEEYIAPFGLYDRETFRAYSTRIASRKHLKQLALDWMDKIDDANKALQEAMRRDRLGIPQQKPY